MRILLLTQWYPPEPQEFLAEMAESLQQFGHEVIVLTGFPNWPSGKIYPGYRIKLWQHETLDKVHLVRIPLYPDHSKSGFRRMLNYVSFAVSATLLGPWLIKRADIIHVIPPITAAIPGWILSRLWGVPFTYEIQDMWPETLAATGMLNNKPILTLIGKLAQFVYQQATAIRVISPGFKTNLVEKGVSPEKIHIISNWVDTSFYRPLPPDLDLAQQLGLKDHFNVMYAGTIGLAQGLETILDAALMLQDIPEVQFVLVGDGADMQRLQQEAFDRRINNVLFLGRYPASQMPHFYALADVLLLHLRDDPLFRITIPHKVFSYLASGKPVLAAIAGDAAEVVVNAQAGLACPPSDPMAMVNVIRTLYQLSDIERRAMGEKGQRTASKSFSREPLIKQIQQMLVETVRSFREFSGDKT